MNFLKKSISTIRYFIINIIESIKRHSTLLLIGFILLSGSFIIFREFFYFGTLTLSINEPNTHIIIDGNPHNLKNEDFILCAQQTCSFSLFPSKHTIFIQKEGFTTSIENVNIHVQKNTKRFIKLQPNNTTITQTAFQKYEGVDFPLQKSIISPKVLNFSLQSNTSTRNHQYLFYKNTPLFPLQKNNPLFVSTDEIGRNVFIVSKDTVTTFDLHTKTTHVSTQQKIDAFAPQSNGTYLLQDDAHIASIAEFPRGTTPARVPIPFQLQNHRPDTIRHVCITPHNTIVFLAKNIQRPQHKEISVFVSQSEKYNLQNAQEKTIIANISLYEVSHITCITDHKINIFLTNKNAYTVTF